MGAAALAMHEIDNHREREREEAQQGYRRRSLEEDGNDLLRRDLNGEDIFGRDLEVAELFGREYDLE